MSQPSSSSKPRYLPQLVLLQRGFEGSGKSSSQTGIAVTDPPKLEAVASRLCPGHNCPFLAGSCPMRQAQSGQKLPVEIDQKQANFI